MRVVSDYTGITRDWFLGDDGDIHDHIISSTAMPKEFDPRKARLFLEYLQLGMTERQAALETPVELKLVKSWIGGYRGGPPNVAEAYIAARERQIHAMAQETIDIADGTDRLTSFALSQAAAQIANPFRPDGQAPPTIMDTLKVMSKNTGERIAARRWYASKLLPLNYGDRLNLEHTGDAKKPVSVNVKSLTTEQLEAIAKLDEELKRGGSS